MVDTFLFLFFFGKKLPTHSHSEAEYDMIRTFGEQQQMTKKKERKKETSSSSSSSE